MESWLQLKEEELKEGSEPDKITRLMYLSFTTQGRIMKTLSLEAFENVLHEQNSNYNNPKVPKNLWNN